MVGNFIADRVKGTELFLYDKGIRTGILLHRKIDSFTDSHPMVEKSKKRLRPHFHKYSPVIVDVFYDHFLAVNWKIYHPLSLEEFTRNTYSILEYHEHIFPERIRRMFYFMKRENWLLSYQSVDGIHRALTGMSRRTKFDSRLDEAASFLERDYALYGAEFEIFIEDLKKICDVVLQNH